MSNEKFSQYFKEKNEMLDNDPVLLINCGIILYCGLLIAGLFLIPVSFMSEWTWMAIGSFALIVLAIIENWRKHWKYSKFERWEKSQRRK